MADVIAPVVESESRQKLRNQDDEEDFLDEGIKNHICFFIILTF